MAIILEGKVKGIKDPVALRVGMINQRNECTTSDGVWKQFERIRMERWMSKIVEGDVVETTRELKFVNTTLSCRKPNTTCKINQPTIFIGTRNDVGQRHFIWIFIMRQGGRHIQEGK